MEQLSIPQTISLRESVIRLLFSQIMSGDLVPGEIYSVAHFAEELKISPTPVREAVLDLASRKLLTIHKNRGFVVPVLTSQELEELHKIRLLLEVPATVEAGMKMDEQQARAIGEIAKSTVATARSHDLTKYIELDRKFHLAFLEPLKMPHLSELIMTYRDSARLRGLRAKLGSRELVLAAGQHVKLVAAAVRKDPVALQDVITDHIEGTRSRWYMAL